MVTKMELFHDFKDVHLLAAELKRRYPHLSDEIDHIKQRFVRDTLELEKALQELRKLAAGERMGLLANLAFEEGYDERQDLRS